MLTKAYYHLISKKIKKDLSQEKRRNKELKYKNIKSKEDMYKSLIEFLGKIYFIRALAPGVGNQSVNEIFSLVSKKPPHRGCENECE